MSAPPEIRHDARPLFCMSCHAELIVDTSLYYMTDGDPLDPSTSGGGEKLDTASSPVAGGTLGHYTTMQTSLFDLLARGRQPTDTPMCQECTVRLLDCVDEQLAAVDADCAEYSRALEQLTSAPMASSVGQQHKRHMTLLQKDADSLHAKLTSLIEEERQLDEQLVLAEREREESERERERLWTVYRDNSRMLLDLEAEEQSVRARMQYANETLGVLSRTNVFNLAFPIWERGPFGTINDLRLGRMPDQPVEWTEINAAWGQCLARRLNVHFVRYEPVPFGSHSYVRVLADGEQAGAGDSSDSASTSSAPPAPSQLPNAAIDLPLYCAGGVKFLGNAKFDTAIVAFIDCVNQLQQRVQHMHTTLQQTASSEVDAQTVSSSAFTLPYTMLKDKLIGGEREYSVKTEFNSEERWTKAMKYLLTNMKWLLTWTAALDP